MCQSSTQVSMGRPALRIDTCTRSVVFAPMSHVLSWLPSILRGGEISQMPSVREGSPSTRGKAQRGAAQRGAAAQHGDGPWMLASALPTRRAATASFIRDANLQPLARAILAARTAPGVEQETGKAGSKALSRTPAARAAEGEQGCASFPKLHNLPRGIATTNQPRPEGWVEQVHSSRFVRLSSLKFESW